MTAVRTTPGIAVETVEEAVEQLRARGLRVSAARRVVLESLFRAEGPVSAEGIAAGSKDVPRSDLASVYRNLETLEQLGLVRHVHLGHGPGLYELARSAQEYIVCESCDAALAVAPEQLDDVRRLLRERFEYEVGFGHFPIVGRCPRCATSTPDQKGASPHA